MADTYQLFCGLDVASRSVTVAVCPADSQKSYRVWTVEQSTSGHRQLHEDLRQFGIVPSRIHIVMEATGTYWMALAHFLHTYRYGIYVINPMSSHHFSLSILNRDKNDPIDARTLCKMGRMLSESLSRWYPPPLIYEKLHQSLKYRDNLVQMRTRTLNRRHALVQRIIQVETVQNQMTSLIDVLTDQIQMIEVNLTKLLQAEHEWTQSAICLLSVKGVGVITAGWILVATQNFATFDTPEQVVSFAGLAPRQRQSGMTPESDRHIGYAGHARLRQAMYMAAMVALQHNPHIRAFYQRLRANKKRANVATVAAARKLLHICWACVTHNRLYDPDY